MSKSTEWQLRNVQRIRSAALASVLRHGLVSAADDSFSCLCGYGLGDASGDLEGRYGSHLAEVRA